MGSSSGLGNAHRELVHSIVLAVNMVASKAPLDGKAGFEPKLIARLPKNLYGHVSSLSDRKKLLKCCKPSLPARFSLFGFCVSCAVFDFR